MNQMTLWDSHCQASTACCAPVESLFHEMDQNGAQTAVPVQIRGGRPGPLQRRGEPAVDLGTGVPEQPEPRQPVRESQPEGCGIQLGRCRSHAATCSYSWMSPPRQSRWTTTSAGPAG